METRNDKSGYSGLPYVNNLPSILITVLATVAGMLVFQWNRSITIINVVISAAICGVLSAVINTLVCSGVIKKMRRAGTLPASVPESRWMMRLPKNAALLSILFAVFFGALAVLVNLALVRFYEIQTFTLLRLVVWLTAFTCWLAAVIAECAILRFIQPDCAVPGEPVQAGTAHVKNPISRLTAFKNWLGTVLADFGFNMAIGLLFGATFVDADHSVVIKPTTRDGIVASSIVLGIIITFRLAYPMAKSIYGARRSGALPPLEKRSGFLAALPEKPLGMTMALMLPIILLSFLVFWSVLTFFDFEVLSFFQFFGIRSIYAAILAKGATALMLARYRQPEKQPKSSTKIKTEASL